MTANPKPDAVTAEEMFKLIEQLSSQIGDDIQVIFNHEALFKKSRAALVYQSAEITRLREQLAEAERQRDVARAEALEDAAQCCADEADRCDDAVKWGGSRRYISDCKAAAYAMRNRAAAIRALIKKDRA